MAGIFPSKIISGGQTGVDRAGLDVALGMGISCGARESQIPGIYERAKKFLDLVLADKERGDADGREA